MVLEFAVKRSLFLDSNMSKDLFFPPDIIADILSRLPVKSLLRFKCLSKSWLSSISNGEFTKQHLKQVIQNKTVDPIILLSNLKSLQLVESHVVADDNFTIVEHDLPIDLSFVGFFYFFLFELFSIGSCNGLIACCDRSDTSLVVFNPTTKQFRDIPIMPQLPVAVNLSGKGFGYDSRIDDYKIVLVRRPNLFQETSVEIFNLKGNSWRTIKERNCSNFFHGEGVFVNGILHWRMTDVEKKYEDVYNVLVRFDLVEERFLDTMKFPMQIWYTRIGLMMLDERLCVCSANLWAKPHFTIWKMMDYGVKDSWTRVYQFSNDNLLHRGLTFQFVTRTGHVVFTKDENYLVIYNPKDEKIERKEMLPPNRRLRQCIVYVESLVSPYNDPKLRSPNMCYQQPNSQAN